MANVDDLVKKSFGQMGSVFTSVAGAITPPTNKVFIAITFLTDTTLDSSGGLGDQIDVNDTFPKGCTIFGRWTEIDIDAGMIIAYIGE